VLRVGKGELEDLFLAPRCPCCGTGMVVVSETKTMLSFSCPACHVSDVRMK